MNSISIDDLAKAIIDALTGYRDDVTAAQKRAIDKTAEKVGEIISASTPTSVKDTKRYKKGKSYRRRRGTYKRAFKLETKFENKYEKRVVWFVKPYEHALTHLLEHGHALRQGGRAKARPHFIYGEEYVQKNLMKNIEEEVQKL